ncbi:MAG TPA: ATP-binding cassette domain-containing protein [Candidatus Dormibacteraeota bacterium]
MAPVRGRRAAALTVAAAAAAAPLPALVSVPVLADVTAAVAMAGAAAGAAIALAAGRPPLLLAAAAAGAGYVSGLIAIHGGAVPLAVLAATAAGALAAALLGLAGTRLDAAGFLVLGLLAAAGGAAAVGAAPGLSAGALGPLPPLSLPLPGDRLAVLGPAGGYHLVLGVAALSVVAAAVLLGRGPGPRWRAVGSDPERAAAASLRPAVAQASALAVAGGLAALGGALAAHATGAAGPAGLGVDAAALPLLAALLAGRWGPAAAALAAVGAGVLGGALLPAAGWSGPPEGRALGTGLLALALLVTLPRRSRRARQALPPPPAAAALAAAAPWPVTAPAGGPRALVVRGLRVTAAGGGPVLLPSLDLEVAAGEVLGLVGANGAGKSSTLRAIEAAARRGAPEVRVEPAAGSGPGRVVRLPQEGGGWPACTVTETLTLAAAAGGGGGDPGAWRRRLGLDGWGDRPCAELPASARRLVELARVLLLRPAVLLCDEPLAGLGADREVVIACLRAAAAAGVAVVLADHDQAAVAALAGRRVRLSGGVAATIPVTP